MYQGAGTRCTNRRRLAALLVLLLAGLWGSDTAESRRRKRKRSTKAPQKVEPPKKADPMAAAPSEGDTPKTGAPDAKKPAAAPPVADFRNRVLVIGTKPAPPFSMQDADGKWQGISIQLWREIAKELKLKFKFKKVTLKQLISQAEAQKLDGSVAALTITAKRESRIDFTHPFFTSGLGIAVRSKEKTSTWDTVKRIFSMGMIKVLLALLGLLTLIGVIIWIFERKRNAEEFGGGVAQGIGAGLWYSAVTMTTVGYGDKSPRTLGGRLVGLVWMFASIIIISSFTATMTTTLTVSRLESSIKGPKDLANKKVGSVANSTSDAYLKDQGIAVKHYPNVLASLQGVAKGEVDAAVYDAPIMRYLAKSKLRGKVRVLSVTFERQDYGFALPNNSPLREEINRILLKKISQSSYKNIVKRYLGE
jgi:polar amino acid transport system substrate-binding protein